MRLPHISSPPWSPPAILLLGLGIIFGFVGAFAEVVQPAHERSELYLTESPAGVWSLGSIGTEATLATFPAGSHFHEIEELRIGWVAAGSVSVPGTRRLTLIEGRKPGRAEHLSGSPVRISAPSTSTTTKQVAPTLFVRNGRLLGIAWLEGEDPLALGVWAAPWEGDGWGQPEQVAPPLPGGQAAPKGAVLADGTWLLAWSAAYGGITEIVWSQRTNGKWSGPNAVTVAGQGLDVQPALVATPDGALLAWSRLEDGEFRLQLARFEKGIWRRLDALAAPGALSARWVAIDRMPTLLYRSLEPDAWSALMVDPDLGPVKEARIPSNASQRPLVISLGSGNMEMLWEGELRQAAPMRELQR